VNGFVDVRRPADLVRVFGADGEIALHRTPDGLWSGDGVVVGQAVEPDHLGIHLGASTGVRRLQLRWHGDPGAGTRYLGDAWERTYGDLEWAPEAPERPMPWSFMAHRPGPDGGRTHGYGVRVRPGALCFWTADRGGLSLWADVRSGGRPLLLGGRTLAVADVVAHEGEPGGSAFEAQRALCRAMCPDPLLPPEPVTGTNDWHVHYGNNSADVILRASEQLAGLAGNVQHRPWSLIDDGWSRGGLGTGPWFGNDRFGDMGALAGRMRDTGVRPGIWYRPLTTLPGVASSWHLRGGGVLDPSRPEVLDVVAEHVRRLGEWGYGLIKHDFTTWDVLGRWGSGMGATVTDDGWGFATADRTTAEVLLDLYRTIRTAADAHGAMVLGCNTIGHLAAGLVEVQRIGDDTSGVSWNRTRRMGVNTLAFRAAQHGTFFAADADVTPVTPHLPEPQARQWLDLVARSGTPLFVSVAPEVDDPALLGAVRAALRTAASGPSQAEPLDWFDTRCPSRWRLDGVERGFDWTAAEGGWPFGD
jgi:alpha-galactosidase